MDTTKVRAKFYVNSVTESKYSQSDSPMKTVKLTPVTSGSEENKEFYKWTPGGHIELSTLNDAAAKQFVIGEAYYVDFIKAS